MPQLMQKAAGIIIEDRSLLVLRSHGKAIYFAPGGKLELEETPRQALVRELREGVSIEVKEGEMKFFASFTAPAAGLEDTNLNMDVFVVNSYQGTISPRSEIAECCWINSDNIKDIKVGSIFRDQVFPLLRSAGLIR